MGKCVASGLGVVCLVWTLTCMVAAEAGEGRNLLRNPGFEEALAPAWHKRTPEDKARKLYCTDQQAHSGTHCVVLENLAEAYTRLRQGNDRSISIPHGSMIALSAWVRSELRGTALITLQIFCMDDKNRQLAQPISGPILVDAAWKRASVLGTVPPGTAYTMAYLQVNGGVGKVFFDDVALKVVRAPRKPVPARRVALFTDLPGDDATAKELKVLLGDGLVPLGEQAAVGQLAGCVGAIVLARSGDVPKPVLDAVVGFAKAGRPVFMDIRNFAQWRGLTPVAVIVAKGKSLQQKMASGLKVVKDSEATAGFEVGQVIPRVGADGKTLLVLPKDKAAADVEVLATTESGDAGLVRVSVGRGSVVAADVLSLREPHCSNVDAYYKYLFLTNTLTSRVQLGEYYPRKLTYTEFVELMKRTAAEFPAIRFQDEGPGCGDYRLCSLNLGREGAPLYFLYAAAHGSEWETGYGLLTFAKRIAQGRLKDVIDLEKCSIKIVPLLNPSGYDARRRHNANGVDLNRQGDYTWEAFKGTDSNKDGTYGPGDYDWKSTAPFVEPEAKVYHKIIQAGNLYCILDYHGNSCATANKVGILPATARDDNELRAFEMQHLVNERLRGRFLLRQSREDAPSQYLITRVFKSGAIPYLMNTAAKGRYGILVELTAGYGETYGTVLQTDVTCEVCRALFVAYPPPK